MNGSCKLAMNYLTSNLESKMGLFYGLLLN